MVGRRWSLGWWMRVIALVAVAGGLSHALGTDEREVVLLALVPAVVVLVPVHCAIEANRRDAILRRPDPTNPTLRAEREP